MILKRFNTIFNSKSNIILNVNYSSHAKLKNQIEIASQKYDVDAWTNITPKISSYVGRNIYLQKNHPLSIVRRKIVNYFYKTYTNSKGNPIFSIYDSLKPVVTVQQNFDDLLIPTDHVSRRKSDCYYVNEDYLLRAHMTAHQVS